MSDGSAAAPPGGEGGNGPATGTGGSDVGGGGETTAAGGTSSGGTSSGGTSTGGQIVIHSGGQGNTTTLEAEVFAHSADELFTLDPEHKTLTRIGELAGCERSVLDIAVDAENGLFGVTAQAFFRIDPDTGACTKLSDLPSDYDFITSLSFLPAGTLDDSEEALVAFDEADYLRFELDTGEATVITTGALTDGVVSSGDIVSVEDGGTFVTVKGGSCSSSGQPDCLYEIDPKTGTLVKDWGTVGHERVFGLGYWGGRAYGFTDGQDLFEIQFGTDSVTTVQVSYSPSTQFYGAGSTTIAPTEILY